MALHKIIKFKKSNNYIKLKAVEFIEFFLTLVQFDQAPMQFTIEGGFGKTKLMASWIY